MAKSKLKAGQFKLGNKVYEPIIPKVFLPGIGVRTALEIASDEEAQSYLVKEGCIGSVIKEVGAAPKEDESE